MDSWNLQMGGEDKPDDINTQNNQRTYNTQGANFMLKIDKKLRKLGPGKVCLPLFFPLDYGCLGCIYVTISGGVYSQVGSGKKSRHLLQGVQGGTFAL